MPQDQYKSKANKLNALNQNRQQQPLHTEPTVQGEPEVSDSDNNEDIFAVSRAEKAKQPPMTKLKINVVKVEFLIDTGASVNILTQKDYEFLCTNSKDQISLRKTKTRIYVFGSSEPVESKGKFEVLVDSKRRVAAATFYVTKGTQGTASILGCETSTNLRLITMDVNSVSKVSEVKSDSGTDTSSCDLDASKRKENLLKGRHPIYANS
jgi:hypothetical protein